MLRILVGGVQVYPNKRPRLDDSLKTNPPKDINDYLNNINQGLVLGVDSYHSGGNQASDLESYVQASKIIFEALYNFPYDGEEKSTTIQLPNKTLTLQEQDNGVEIDIDGEKKLITDVTIRSLYEALFEDIRSHPDQFGIELSAYVNNINEYGDRFTIYNKSLSFQPFYKSQTYLPMGQDKTVTNLNGKVHLPSQDNKIVCRHLAAQFVIDSLRNENGKVNFTEHYNSPDAIAAHIPRDIEECYDKLKAHATRTDMIKNDNLGKHLTDCFLDMQKPEKNETVKALLIESTTHSMAIRLRIKSTAENPVYVVEFFDPNISNTAVRYETDALSTIQQQTLKQYLIGASTKENNSYQHYYGKIDPISLLTECNLSSLTKDPVNEDKRLTHLDSDPLTPTHIHLMLFDNFPHDLAELEERLKKIGQNSSEELATLLSAKNEDDTPGLYYALKYNNVQAIKAYGKLLQLLPEDKRAQLIIAQKQGGETGIVDALKNDRAETVDAFVELLKLLPEDKRMPTILSLNFGTQENLRRKLFAAFKNTVRH